MTFVKTCSGDMLMLNLTPALTPNPYTTLNQKRKYCPHSHSLSMYTRSEQLSPEQTLDHPWISVPGGFHLRNPPLKLNVLNVLNRLPPWSSLRAHSVSSFCDFQKITFRDLTEFFSFLSRENLVFFRYFY